MPLEFLTYVLFITGVPRGELNLHPFPFQRGTEHYFLPKAYFSDFIIKTTFFFIRVIKNT